VPVFSTAQLTSLIGENQRVTVTCKRLGADRRAAYDIELSFPDPSSDSESQFFFEVPEYRAKTYSFFSAIGQGFLETGKMIGLTVKSIGLLFRGVDVTQAVSGPVRITVMIGDTVQTGFRAGFNTGLVSVCNLLALISVSLFLMNLLPVPVLDGGIVLFSCIEIITRKQLKPRFLYYIQFVGIAFIALLFILAIFSDVRYIVFRK
jgi:regulator of sigma E protease